MTKVFASELYILYFLLECSAKNTRKIVDNINVKVSETCPQLSAAAKAVTDKFEPLFNLFAACHFAYNSSDPMEEDEITTLGKISIIVANIS